MKNNIVDEAYKVLEEQGLELISGTHFENDGGRSKLFLCNDDAETSDDYFMYETYGIYDMIDYLKRNKLVEVIQKKVVCPYCEGDGQVKDWADDVLGNTISWWDMCECCEGEGEIPESEYKLAKEVYIKPNRILREELDREEY